MNNQNNINYGVPDQHNINKSNQISNINISKSYNEDISKSFNNTLNNNPVKSQINTLNTANNQNANINSQANIEKHIDQNMNNPANSQNYSVSGNSNKFYPNNNMNAQLNRTMNSVSNNNINTNYNNPDIKSSQMMNNPGLNTTVSNPQKSIAAINNLGGQGNYSSNNNLSHMGSSNQLRDTYNNQMTNMTPDKSINQNQNRMESMSNKGGYDNTSMTGGMPQTNMGSGMMINHMKSSHSQGNPGGSINSNLSNNPMQLGINNGQIANPQNSVNFNTITSSNTTPNMIHGQNLNRDNMLTSNLNNNIGTGLGAFTKNHQHNQINPMLSNTVHGHGHVDPTSQQANLAREREKMKKLSSKKTKFDDLFKKKLTEFKDTINKNLKERFDKDLKRALYHLWKHYENCNKYSDRAKVDQLLKDNLEKVRKETKDFRIQASNQSKELIEEERETLAFINNNIIEDVNSAETQQSKLSDNQRKQELNNNIMKYQSEVTRLKKDINYMKESRNDRVYEIKLQLEKEGREEMEERARELVLTHCNDTDEEIRAQKFDVLDLKKKYSSFEAGNQNYTQEEKTEIDRLLKEIADTDNIIKSQFHNKS